MKNKTKKTQKLDKTKLWKFYNWLNFSEHLLFLY